MLDWVAPREKTFACLHQRFDKKRPEYLAMYPRFGTGGILLGQMPQADDALEPLEDEFYLPASPVELQRIDRAEDSRAERSEHKDVACSFKCGCADFLLFACTGLSHSLHGYCGSLFAPLDSAYSSRNGGAICCRENGRPVTGN